MCEIVGEVAAVSEYANPASTLPKNCSFAIRDPNIMSPLEHSVEHFTGNNYGGAPSFPWIRYGRCCLLLRPYAYHSHDGEKEMAEW